MLIDFTENVIVVVAKFRSTSRAELYGRETTHVIILMLPVFNVDLTDEKAEATHSSNSRKNTAANIRVDNHEVESNRLLET